MNSSIFAANGVLSVANGGRFRFPDGSASLDGKQSQIAYGEGAIEPVLADPSHKYSPRFSSGASARLLSDEDAALLMRSSRLGATSG